MTARKKPAEESKVEEKPQTTSQPKTNKAIGGFAELQAKADADTARGYAGGAKEEK